MAQDRIMYVCAGCAVHNPEGCGHFDRNELRVMPSGEWSCEPCFDEVMPEDQSWSDFQAPPEYTALPTHGGDKGNVDAKRLRQLEHGKKRPAQNNPDGYPDDDAPQPATQGDKAAMDDQRDPDATRSLRMEQFEEERRKAQDTSVAWPPLKKALWNVLMTENLNDGHYIRAFDLIEKLYSTALASSSPKHKCQNWAGDCAAYISTGVVCDACRIANAL